MKFQPNIGLGLQSTGSLTGVSNQVTHPDGWQVDVGP